MKFKSDFFFDSSVISLSLLKYLPIFREVLYLQHALRNSWLCKCLMLICHKQVTKSSSIATHGYIVGSKKQFYNQATVVLFSGASDLKESFISLKNKWI